MNLVGEIHHRLKDLKESIRSERADSFACKQLPSLERLGRVDILPIGDTSKRVIIPGKEPYLLEQSPVVPLSNRFHTHRLTISISIYADHERCECTDVARTDTRLRLLEVDIMRVA